MEKKRVCLVGASGRMGQRLIRLLGHDPALRLAAMLTRPGGRVVQAGDAKSVHHASEAVALADVVIDFAAPTVCAQVAPACAQAGVPYVLASTGLSPADQKALDDAAVLIPVLQAANLSIGVNVMLELVRTAASQLSGFEIEIAEIHHRHKRDAPSGTAFALGEAACRGGGPKTAVTGRHGTSNAPRSANELGYAAIRGGEVPGEHTVYFFGDAERLEITHRSASGDIFAAGAITAATWLLAQKKPGRFTMRDVLRGHPTGGQ